MYYFTGGVRAMRIEVIAEVCLSVISLPPFKSEVRISQDPPLALLPGTT